MSVKLSKKCISPPVLNFSLMFGNISAKPCVVKRYFSLHLGGYSTGQGLEAVFKAPQQMKVQGSVSWGKSVT